jgi:hypothetical protein
MTARLEWLKDGRAPRGTPRRRGSPHRLLALGLIAGLAFVQAGCQSGPFSDCGSCNPCGFFRRATSRVLNRPSGCCDSGVVGGSTVDYGAPSTVVGTPAAAAPLYTPGPPAGSVPSTVPVSPDNPTTLDAIPKARSTPLPGSSSTSGSGASRSGYYTRQTSTRTAVRLDAGASTGRTSDSRSSKDRKGREDSQEDDNPLDHLPPLALPGEVTQAETRSSAPSAHGPEGRAGDISLSEASARSGDLRAEDEVSLTVSADSPSGVEPTPGGATGIARFASVDPRLAGGSLPSTTGLGWLAEKGYRTVLDLRESSEVSPTFIAETARRGLRYVALPVSLQTLDPDRLARFHFELAAPEARPLFFFDSDGSRAGALWYIRRITQDRVDAGLARREAEDIGLKDQAAWRSAMECVRKLEAARSHPAPFRAGASDSPDPLTAGSTPAGVSAQRPAEDLVTGSDRHPNTVTAEARGKRPNPQNAPAASSTMPGSVAPNPASPMESFSAREALSWRPIAAMLLTGLSLPLAYWTRTAIPDVIERARASLPGPGLRRRSLPHESGV